MKLQDYDFELCHISGKTNMKADILSRKDQVNTWDDIQILKEELWTRRTTVEVTMLWKNKIIGETNLLEEIQWNRTKEKEVVQELKKMGNYRKTMDWFMWIDKFIFLITGKFKNKFYEKTMILSILDI